MPQDISPAGYVGTKLKEATVAEATGTHGTVFMQTNLETIANKVRYRNDDGTESQETVIAPTLLNSWANTGGSTTAAGYYKDRDGRVHLRGRISSGTVPSQVFVLPAGYRPAALVGFAVKANSAFGSVDVDNAGGVYVQSGANTSVCLDGVSFRI